MAQKGVRAIEGTELQLEMPEVRGFAKGVSQTVSPH